MTLPPNSDPADRPYGSQPGLSPLPVIVFGALYAVWCCGLIALAIASVGIGK